MSLRVWLEQGAISDLDVQFARQLGRLDGASGEPLEWAAALCSQWRERGHVRLDLPSLTPAAVHGEGGEDGELVTLPPADAWIETLGGSCVVGKPGDFRPLILDEEGGLYLQRYWQYEQDIAEAIQTRTLSAMPESLTPRVLALADRLFPAVAEETDWQRAAAMLALRGRVTLISGGPGTGKTSTVVRILALLVAAAGDRPLSIALAAPTGKAATRLQDAIRRSKGDLPIAADLISAIPDEAVTLHRLLGARPGRAGCRFNEHRPLPYDLVIVDEASMVDVALMAKLFRALHEEARVLLLGDKDQLASVEAGALFGDLCGPAGDYAYSDPVKEFLVGHGGVQTRDLPAGKVAAAGLRDHIVLLRRNYRFAAGGGIGGLASAIRHGDIVDVMRILRSSCRGATDVAQASCLCPADRPALPGDTGKMPVPRASGKSLHRVPQQELRSDEHELVWHEAPTLEGLAERMRERLVPFVKDIGRAGDPAVALASLGGAMILCAHHYGPYGVRTVNDLARGALPASARRTWYPGRPVLITRNDYPLRLFNGDTGVAMMCGGELRVVFPSADGTVRELHPGRLPEHTTAYAMTIHRAQGSEFDDVVVVLPENDSPILSRELIYTAVTRARRSVEIWARPEVLAAAIDRPIARAGGLRRLLWGQG